jgi:hypothetical protein
MSHVRTQIRDEIVTRLLTLPGLSGRVQASRVYTAQKTPFVIVYTATEEAQSDVIARPSQSQRQLTVRIEIYSKAGSDIFDTQIDNLCEQIEPELDTTIGKFTMCQTWQYLGLAVDFSGAGERAAGVATLEYEFTYRVDESDSSTGV